MSDKMSVDEFRKTIKSHPKPKKTKRKNKYGAVKKKYQTRLYDSTGEANYAKKLDWQKKFGEIREIIPQYKIEIKINDVFICNYYVDFKVIYQNGKIEFHEYKGYATELWRLKWRLAKAMYPENKFVLIKHRSKPW